MQIVEIEIVSACDVTHFRIQMLSLRVALPSAAVPPCHAQRARESQSESERVTAREREESSPYSERVVAVARIYISNEARTRRRQSAAGK